MIINSYNHGTLLATTYRNPSSSAVKGALTAYHTERARKEDFILLLVNSTNASHIYTNFV